MKEILTLPDPNLRCVSKPVENFDHELRTLVKDMVETMRAAQGVGLAAIQVAVPFRVLVVDSCVEEQMQEPLCIINPEFLSRSEELSVYEEGCLSIPGFTHTIERPASCTIRFYDLHGQLHERDCAGLMATVIQHEMDHLNGVLLIDYLSKFQRDRVVKRYLKIKKHQESGQP